MPLPLRVMVRENAGYTTDDGERPALRRAAAAFAAAKVDGIVIGFADAGELELDHVADVLTAAPDVNVTFHRAFDQAARPARGHRCDLAAAPRRSHPDERR